MSEEEPVLILDHAKSASEVVHGIDVRVLDAIERARKAALPTWDGDPSTPLVSIRYSRSLLDLTDFDQEGADAHIIVGDDDHVSRSLLRMVTPPRLCVLYERETPIAAVLAKVFSDRPDEGMPVHRSSSTSE